mgnify:CR=1 FL=1
MLTSIFSIIINWFLLQSLLQIALVFNAKPIYGIPAQTASIILSVGVMGAIVLLSLTPIGEIFLRIISGGKPGHAQEREKIQGLFDEVCILADIDPGKFSLYISNDPKPNAWALGSKTIIVSRGLLAEANKEEIKGVLAHEIGHIVLGHTLWLTITYAAGQVGFFIIRLYVLITQICVVLSYIPLLGLLMAPITWAIAISLKLFQWFITLPFSLGSMFGSRLDEYAADNFASRIGQGDGLYSFLNRVVAPKEKYQSFFEKMYSTHPRVKKRLSRLDLASET